jgi:predicted acyl esterase
MARRIRTQPRRGLHMRRLVRSFAVLIAVLALGGCDALIARFILPSEGIRPAEYAVAIERNVTMTTSDAVALVADIHRPKMNGAAPTILVRIPFSRTFRNSLSADAVGRFWASRGYIVVVQGTRGRFKSGGAFYPLRHERQDGIETLQWLARQPWFDGRLGMWGGSAFGHTQWALADQSRPSPTALMRDQRGVIGRSAMAARSSRLAPSRRARSSDII